MKTATLIWSGIAALGVGALGFVGYTVYRVTRDDFMSGMFNHMIPPGTPIPIGAGPQPGRNLSLIPTSSGTTQGKVGDTVSITGISPYTPANPNGFAVYADPGILETINSNAFRIVLPGLVHIAFPGGNDVYIQALA